MYRLAPAAERLAGGPVLVDPFGVVEKHKEDFGECYLPDVPDFRYNPLSFIREDEGLAVRDINVLLDALLTPPRAGGPENSGTSTSPPAPSSPDTSPGCASASRATTRRWAWSIACSRWGRRRVRSSRSWSGARSASPAGWRHIAVERQAQVGKEEGGSNFSTIANQLAFLNYPELRDSTSETSFSPMMLAEGDTDLFVVVPEDTVEHVKGWLRLWVAIPNAVAGIRPLERDMLILIDEMPRLGYLKPVMDGYTMAAGKGVHFWCFASRSRRWTRPGQGTPQDAAGPR